jgi:hypothetical protein
MAKYSIHVFCNECTDVHPTGIVINLDDGPVNKASIGDTYAGKELPIEVATLKNNTFTCPNTSKPFSQSDNDQVFLVPISN